MMDPSKGGSMATDREIRALGTDKPAEFEN